MAAGQGFKTFATGDVLSASDVNGYLMQGVLVFADATERNAEITSPQEGQFAYLKDTNVTTYYTGSAWANLDTTGMTNPMTTTGDTIYSSSGSTPARLGIGSTGQVLTVSGGVPSWSTPSSGKVVQIVNATNSTQTITASSTFTDTNLTATITPTSASNQILVFVSQNGVGKYNSNTQMQIRLVRGATTILALDSFAGHTNSAASNWVGSVSCVYLDSPATTSATTYKTQFNSQAGTGSVILNEATSPGTTSTILLMEVTP
jgi:hypothetical protein